MDDFWHKNLFKNRIPHITGSFIKDFVSANLPIKATQAQGYKFFLCFVKKFISLGRLAEAKSSIKELVMWGILSRFLCQKSTTSRFPPYPFTTQGLGSMLKIMTSNPRWPPCDISKWCSYVNKLNSGNVFCVASCMYRKVHVKETFRYCTWLWKWFTLYLIQLRPVMGKEGQWSCYGVYKGVLFGLTGANIRAVRGCRDAAWPNQLPVLLPLLLWELWTSRHDAEECLWETQSWRLLYWNNSQ